MYTAYERIWHWLQATIMMALIVTGLEIHAPDALQIAGFEAAVAAHKILGFLLIGNAFLGMLYHLFSGEIRQYFSSSLDFLPLAIRQASYYLYGTFRGRPHPFVKRPDRKHNPLQRSVYVIILNVLLPLQVVTGLLLWGAQRWPNAVGAVGGLANIAAVHTAGAWAFTAFLIMHVYLISTGPTPLSNLRAMITGWEEHEIDPGPGRKAGSARTPRITEGGSGRKGTADAARKGLNA
jgi:Ni/Fe-hydrogenase b-type cytochrome subunit